MTLNNELSVTTNKTVIAKRLGLKTTSGLKEAIEGMGGEYKRTSKAAFIVASSSPNSHTQYFIQL